MLTAAFNPVRCRAEASNSTAETQAHSNDDAIRLAIAARDQGRPDEALSLWNKAVELSPTDGFLLNQKSWALLALGRTREAIKAFKKALELSTDSAGISEADFGIGMALSMDSEIKPAAQSFQSVCTQSPYLYPIAATWMAQLALRNGKPQVALLYLKHAMERDPYRPDAADALAALYERDKSPQLAWRTYRMAWNLNPLDSEAEKGMRRLEESLHETPEHLSVTRRFPAPLLQKPSAPPPSAVLRVGLFADRAGVLAMVQRFRFASGGEFKLSKGGNEVASGRTNENWEASWDPESRVLEVRDSSRKLRYAGRDKVRIEPAAPGGGVLIRDIALDAPKGRDLGDREFRGALELQPATSGFFLINELGSEEYLYSEVAAAAPAGSPVEALKAEAILSRTRLQELKRKLSRPDLGLDLCDSSYCQAYLGISQERSEATQAVMATAGQMLYLSSQTMSVQQTAHCGGVTEEGIVDAGTGTAPVRSPELLERFLHSDPFRDNFCNASPIVPSSQARWLRVLDAKQVLEALSDRGRLGRMQGVEILSRSSTGRINGLQFIGSEGKVRLDGAKDLGEILPRLGIRSALFSIQPLYHGKEATTLLVWGAGAGNGHGMCIAGAVGQAYLGRGYKEILTHYFPGAEIR